jgi:hypothetical protein
LESELIKRAPPEIDEPDVDEAPEFPTEDAEDPWEFCCWFVCVFDWVVWLDWPEDWPDELECEAWDIIKHPVPWIL